MGKALSSKNQKHPVPEDHVRPYLINHNPTFIGQIQQTRGPAALLPYPRGLHQHES